MLPPIETQDSYIALNYCWGVGKKGYVTTKANLSKRKDDGFEATILPMTIRDAIELTRRLRIRYVWVDGICICQDDAADWDRESRPSDSGSACVRICARMCM